MNAREAKAKEVHGNKVYIIKARTSEVLKKQRTPPTDHLDRLAHVHRLHDLQQILYLRC